MNPDFLRARVTRQGIEDAAKRKPSEQTVDVFLRGIIDAAQKLGWARAEAEKAETAEERAHFTDRGQSANATVIDSSGYWQDHAPRAQASERAQQPRRDWLSRKIIEHLREDPTLDERGMFYHLRQEANPDAAKSSVIRIDDDMIVWRNEAGKEKKSRLKDRLSRARREI